MRKKSRNVAYLSKPTTSAVTVCSELSLFVKIIRSPIWIFCRLASYNRDSIVLLPEIIALNGSVANFNWCVVIKLFAFLAIIKPSYKYSNISFSRKPLYFDIISIILRISFAFSSSLFRKLSISFSQKSITCSIPFGFLVYCSIAPFFR